MLTIHTNKNAAGLVRYFNESLSKDDYFFSGDSIPGRWHGKLATELGLPEKVSQKSFKCLAQNIHPVSGKKLTARNAAERRVSIEYTFSAPKSVSLVWAFADKEKRKEILNAHRLAVKKAMAHIEADMRTQTRTGGRKVYAKADGIVYARFDHFTSRPTKELESDLAKYSSDPQLHSHCITFNCTRFRGKYQALEGSVIHRAANYYESIYHSHLSKSLQELGYNITRTKDRWEIYSPGLTRQTIKKFSRRMLEVEKLAKKLGITNPKKKGELAAKSRISKSKIKDNANLKKIWFSKLTSMELRALQNAQSEGKEKTEVNSSQKAIDKALAHHLERQSTVGVKKLLGQALSLGYGTLTLNQVKKELSLRENILYAQKHYLKYLTTKEMVRAEDKMIAFASSGKSTLPAINSKYQIQRTFLNEGQQKAIHQILKSNDRVSILAGSAGVGKSTLLVEIKEAAEEKGRRIVAVAPSSSASRVVLREKGFKSADTIATFLKSRELQNLARNNIILVDEASLVGVKTMNNIFKVAHKVNARIILSGDIRQHSSVEHGSALKQLQEKCNLKIASVKKILRQRNNPQYKKVIDLLAKGHTRQGFEKLNKMNAVIEVEDTAQRHQKIAIDYVQSLEQKRSALCVCPTHAEGRLISEAIRAKMKERGRISGIEKNFIIQRNLSLTEAQKQDHAIYEPGMRVQFHQNYKGVVAGKKYEVVSKNKNGQIFITALDDTRLIRLPTKAFERFQVFQKDELKISKGDFIRMTNNGRTLEKTRIHNGQTFIVNGFTPQGHIQLSNGKTLPKTYANFTHAYVETSHSAQGKDCQDVLVAQASMSFPAVNEKTFYVSSSRATDTIKIYTDDKDALREAVSKSGEKMTAREIADKQYDKYKRVRYYSQMIKKYSKDERKKEPALKIKLSYPVKER